MTEIADSAVNLGSGLVQKTFSYSPLDALVDIVFNKAGQIVQAAVQKATGGSSTSGSQAAASSAAPSGAVKRSAHDHRH